MTGQSIPAIDDLSAEWFTDLLRGSGDLDGGTAVIAVDMETIGDGASMMSELARAHLTYDAVTGAPDASDRQGADHRRAPTVHRCQYKVLRA